jgi:hypothetical protein
MSEEVEGVEGGGGEERIKQAGWSWRYRVDAVKVCISQEVHSIY